ncbi:MAG TPA: hypothetical protein EYH40_02985 [Desulfurococcales archaeon]|nr:hypothetical protein [Desulfurococcales archaeon]
MDVIELVRTLTIRITMIAWALFILSWVLGWAIRGSPIPLYRVKRVGQDIVEDAIVGAFWLAIGTTVFALISYITTSISVPLPPPPTIVNTTTTTP